MPDSNSKRDRVTGLIKGAPTAVLVSIGIHVVLLLLATVFVVVNIVKPEPIAFVPPEKFDRPKMNLRKLRVKVKQDTKPKRSATRITSKTPTAMPDIQLPPMTGLGGGLGEGLGGFQVMADLSQITLMGGAQSVGNDLVGSFYDLKRLKSGIENPKMPERGANQGPFRLLLEEFVSEENNWDDKILDPYYRAPKKLYASCFMVPVMESSMAPSKFGMSDQMVASYWLAHYKGEIGLKDRGGRFRFVGDGDNILLVRINGELVLDATYLYGGRVTYWQTPEPRRDRLGIRNAYVGDWFTLEPGVPVTMELLTGEEPGGDYAMMLLIEEEGVEYPEDKRGNPILPMFKTMELPPHLVDEIKYRTPEDSFDITGGPIFEIY